MSGSECITAVVLSDHEEVARMVGRRIAGMIRDNWLEGRRTVLGLATGSTPIGVHRELVRMHREEDLSFRGRWTSPRSGTSSGSSRRRKP